MGIASAVPAVVGDADVGGALPAVGLRGATVTGAAAAADGDADVVDAVADPDVLAALLSTGVFDIEVAADVEVGIVMGDNAPGWSVCTMARICRV